MKVLDTTCLSALFVSGATVCRKGTTIPIKYAKERLELLVNTIARNHEQVIIPTPVLSELLVRTPPDKVSNLIDQLNSSIWFRVESFDAAAAIELGTRTAKAIAQGDKREGLSAGNSLGKSKVRPPNRGDRNCHRSYRDHFRRRRRQGHPRSLGCQSS